MTCDNKKEILITTHGDLKINSFNKNTGKLKGFFDCTSLADQKVLDARGVTTDGHGHLFVCDVGNNCIRLFSMHGRHLGTLLKQGDHGIGRPWWIRWNPKNSSLVIVHEKSKRWCCKVINNIGLQFLASGLSKSGAFHEQLRFS